MKFHEAFYQGQLLFPAISLESKTHIVGIQTNVQRKQMLMQQLNNMQDIYKGLRHLNERGTTIFLTTHDMAEAETLCNRVAFLYKGEIQEIGTPNELKKQYRDGLITVELTDGQQHELPMGEQSATEIAQWMTQGVIERMRTNEPSLGDIFMTLTGSDLT